MPGSASPPLPGFVFTAAFYYPTGSGCSDTAAVLLLRLFSVVDRGYTPDP